MVRYSPTDTLRNLSDELAADLAMPKASDRALSLMLLRGYESVMTCVRPHLLQNDLTEQQWRVLRATLAADSLDAQEVSRRACVPAPSLTRIMRSLEDRGLLRRRIDPKDKRRTLLSATPAAVAMTEQIGREITAEYVRFLADFGADRYETLLELLQELAERNDC